MMLHISPTGAAQLPEAITQAVIGRPINFQGLGGDEAKHPCARILERAAKRAGFKDVVFQPSRSRLAGLRSHLAGRKNECW